MLEAIADIDLRAIVTKIVEKAKGGDLVAAKLIFDRLAPAPKSRTVGTAHICVARSLPAANCVLHVISRNVLELKRL
jgi:hypothetical protein